jgi:hypothetical protein
MPVGDIGERLPLGLLCGATRDPAIAAATDRGAKKVAARQPRAAADADAEGPLVIRTHSTEGIIYYLGELTRLQLGLVPPNTGDWDPNIFHLREGAGGPGAITASFQGRDYHIEVDPTGADRSSQVLDLVTELLAQNNGQGPAAAERHPDRAIGRAASASDRDICRNRSASGIVR